MSKKAEKIMKELDAIISGAEKVPGVGYMVEFDEGVVSLIAIYPEELEYTDEPFDALKDLPPFNNSFIIGVTNSTQGRDLVFQILEYHVEDEDDEEAEILERL